MDVGIIGAGRLGQAMALAPVPTPRILWRNPPDRPMRAHPAPRKRSGRSADKRLTWGFNVQGSRFRDIIRTPDRPLQGGVRWAS